jgi:uncharacterized caspase-like protein
MHATGEDEGGRRLALVIATSSYTDATLSQLRAPGRDATDLAAVLSDDAIGGFEVTTVLDAPADTVRRTVARFCAQGDPRDIVLIYLSCHGLLDDRGRLYYATVDTDHELLSVTAVQAAWFNEHLEDCRCRRQILVLDCCHSGAFAKGAKGDSALALRERFEGRGRVVLTASRATEYSFEGESAVGEGTSSRFTGALVSGLRTGEADSDGDGLITVTELYDYAYRAVKATEARQTPSLWTYGAEGSLLVAHSPRGTVIERTPLPRRPPAPDAPGTPPRVPDPSPSGARTRRLTGLLARNKGRSVAAAVALLALIAGVWALARGADGDSLETGPAISMLAVDGERVIATTYLKQYDTPPTLLHIELTPGGPRYQLLLFDDLEDVRSFKRRPRSAVLVRGDVEEKNGDDLTTGERHDTSYSRTYSPELPANFRQYRYFGIVRAADSGWRLVLYNLIAKLRPPR